MFEHVQQEAESGIARLSEDNRRLQIGLQEVQKAAEGQVAYIARQAELDRERAVKELQMLGAKLEAAHQQLMNSERVASMSGSICGSHWLGTLLITHIHIHSLHSILISCQLDLELVSPASIP